MAHIAAAAVSGRKIRFPTGLDNGKMWGKSSSDIENVDWDQSGPTGQVPSNIRFGSTSSQASQNSGDICRICHCESDPLNPLLTPCYCSGSLKYVHQACLQQWLTASETNACELCKFPFIMHTKIKPFNEWRSLEMSGVERRRLFCAVLFHCAAALCVIWSLCVLIERAAEEVKRGLIGWPFWTKLVVVTVGLTGGVVFMYIQCRQYIMLCNRWRARNRIMLIQNAPEKIRQVSPPSPTYPICSHSLRNGSSSTTNDIIQSSSSRAPLGQIVANIENNSLQYERDWTLDDSSQTSFRPCPQSSGSMTPLAFHDIQGSCSRSMNDSVSDLSHRQSLHTLMDGPSYRVIIANEHQPDKPIIALPGSAVFLENGDILNDIAPQSTLTNRHSTVLVAPDISSQLDKCLGTHIRRFSDTKLIQQCDYTKPIFNVTNVLKTKTPETDVESNYPPAMTDISFENRHKLMDDLDNSIQEVLDMDISKQHLIQPQPCEHDNSRYSMINITEKHDNYETNKNSQPDGRGLFKSLPNLSASSENLLPK